MLTETDERYILKHNNKSIFYTKAFLEGGHDAFHILFSSLDRYIDSLIEVKDESTD